MRSLTAEKLSEEYEGRTGKKLSSDAIVKLERGIRPINLEQIIDFALVLDCSIQTLLEGTDPRLSQTETTKEMRMLSEQSNRVMRWVGSEWEGDSDALITAFGMYAAVPGEYRKWAMLELLTQKGKAIESGAMTEGDIPDCVKEGMPHLEELLGGLYVE